MPNFLLTCSLRSVTFSFVAASAVCVISGCGNGVDANQAARITSPVTQLRVTQQATLANITTITGSPLNYYVNGVAGGDAEVGTISSVGVYTAPKVVPNPDNIVTITSIARDYPKGTPGMVKLTILNPVPVINTVNPSKITEGKSTIFINGTDFLYGAKVLWNGVIVPTTYVNSTKLAAVINPPTPGMYTLAVRNPNPGSADSATLNENVGPGQVTITLNFDPTVRVNNKTGLGVNVGGTNNTGLTWTVNGIPNGNAEIGAITVDAKGNATFAAPAVVPKPNNVVTITATSVDDPTVSATQRMGIMNPVPVLFSANPGSFTTGTATTTTLNGNNFIQGATLLVNGTAVPTTFVSGNQLTADLRLSASGTIDLQVMNPSPGPATSADLLATVTGDNPVELVTPPDASRFLGQSTFGATDQDIRHLSTIGYDAWFNEQFSTPITLRTPYIEQSVLIHNFPKCKSADFNCFFFQNLDSRPVYQSFWHEAVAGNDQLRQRMVYSLTEMMVISNINGAIQSAPRGMANYYDMLGNDAFGNFRQILQDVTLHPMMGKFLSMLGNDKGDANRDPDENYAREVMQLFSIGLYQLNPDGTQKLDASGKPIATYNNNDVMALAKVFTGFSWNNPNDATDTGWWNCCTVLGPGVGADIQPMRSYPSHHSTAEKTFLGVTIPASGMPDPDGDLKIALDTIFNHPNLPPFVSKQLIQHLVTSNPSPAYVGRVAAVFQDNGFGVRGDMKAVIRAILLDDEARNTVNASNNAQFGKVREPLLRFTNWARAFSAQSRTGVYTVGDTSDPIWGLGQMSLTAPSVFNWFAPGYVPPGTSIEKAGLVAPEMQITNVSSVVGYVNFMQNAIGSTAEYGPDLFASYSAEIAMAQNPDQLLDRINLLLMAGNMSASLRSQILGAVNSITVPSNGDQNAVNAALTNRVRIAIYLTMASPSYIAQY